MMISTKRALVRVILYNDRLSHIDGNWVFKNKRLVILTALKVLIPPARLASQSHDVFIIEFVLRQVLTSALVLRSMQGPPNMLLANEFLVWDLRGVEFEDLIR